MMRAPSSSMPAKRSRHAHGGAERAGLEAAASEFALLAQRRARLERQLALLGRQAEATVGNLSRVERRMRVLSGRLTLPEGTQSPQAAPPPPPPPPPPQRSPIVSALARARAEALARTARGEGQPRARRAAASATLEY